MSVQRVTITAADEKHAPPEHEIDFAMVGDDVFITVYGVNGKDERTKEYAVPVIGLADLLAVHRAFSDGGYGFRFERALPGRPVKPSA